MKIVFNKSDYQRTERIQYYCLEVYYLDDTVNRVVNFGLRQRKNMLEFIDRKLRETKISSLTIKIKSYEK